MKKTHILFYAAMAVTLLTTNANAQNAIDKLLEEVVVTATKKKSVENVQDVAASISAYGAQQLDALQVRNISSLSFSTPNVSLDDIGTAKGTANFSIRGLGVNSSIPSIDPAVGVFMDGMYYGTNAGVVFDTFDLESIEVLRGPQGVLFGRNVTGGAVVMNTADPSHESSSKIKVAAESGFRGTGTNLYLMGATTGALVEDKLAGKLALYYNDDGGWFENTLADGSKEDYGESETKIIRPSIKWTPSENVEFTVKFEHGEQEGHGPASQSHTNGSGVPGAIVNFDRNSHDFSINDGMFNESEWNSLVVETNIDVAFGDGRITNILGYRDYSSAALSDIDATPVSIFHAGFGYEQDQISNELRFNGQFGDWDITTGLFYFEQDLAYDEIRIILEDFFGSLGLPASIRPGGGIQDQKTIGVFAQAEYQVNEKLSLTVGLRYSDEEKEVKIASVLPGYNNLDCRVTKGTCVYDFPLAGNEKQGKFSTDNVAPKVGFGYEISDSSRFYGHWTKSFRAGGYNFRNTAADTVNFGPGPFEDEEVSTFELGWKSEPTDSSRINVAIFQTNIDDMQREINRSDPVSGVVQVIRNTADAEIFGVELDGQVAIGDNLLLTASLGYLDADYKKILFDLNGDGAIDNADLDLDIPRLADLTANIGLLYETELGNIGAGAFRINYSHRDEAAYTDNNLGTLNEVDRIDVSFAVSPSESTSVTLYGKNITDEVQHGNDTQLPSLLGPAPVGGSFAPLATGRVFGLEVQHEF